MRKAALIVGILLAVSVTTASAGAGAAANDSPFVNMGTDGYRSSAVQETPEEPARSSLKLAKAGAWGAWGTRGAIGSVGPEYTIRQLAPEVRLQFSVSDERGHLVRDLPRASLRIFDDRVPVSQIRHFSIMNDLPLELGVVLDVSDSVKPSLIEEKDAAFRFIHQVLRPESDRAFVLAFAAEVKLWQENTGNTEELALAARRVRQNGSATNLYDALFEACFNHLPLREDGDPAHRALVLISDGNDTGSLHGLGDVIALAQRREIQIYALTVHHRRGAYRGDQTLQDLAEATGGQLFIANSEKDLPGIFSRIEQEMRTQFLVAFEPGKRNSGYHDLRLEVTAPGKFHVHARQGYYAAPPR